MALVTAKEVKAIMDDCSIEDPKIDVFIIAAHSIVSLVFKNDTVLGSVAIKEIERWLTAHFVTNTLQKYTIEEKLGEATVKYAGKYEAFLKSTPYGQTVLQLDITGKMASYTGKTAASMYAVKSGKEL
jgi:hypothetical protein